MSVPWKLKTNLKALYLGFAALNGATMAGKAWLSEAAAKTLTFGWAAAGAGPAAVPSTATTVSATSSARTFPFIRFLLHDSVGLPRGAGPISAATHGIDEALYYT